VITVDLVDRALALFSPAPKLDLGYPHMFVNAFDTLGSEITVRSRLAAMSGPVESATLQQGRLFTYASFRLTELLLRVHQLDWMRQAFLDKTGEEASGWRMFAGLAIKDFHVDLGSLMDAISVVVLQVTGAFDAAGELKFPGFADVQKNGSARSKGFRLAVPKAILDIVDDTDQWWPPVKSIRDALAHREHHKIVFGTAKQGILFQVYDPPFDPKVLDAQVLWTSGKDVADFKKYSAVCLCRVFLLLDDLGQALASHLGVGLSGLAPLMRMGDFTAVMEPIQSLSA
jgi:hypothetical protein